MKRKTRWIPAMAALLSAPLLFGTPLQAQDEETWAYGDEYQAGNYGRVLYHENGVTIRRAAPEQDAPPSEQAALNAPVFPGDTLVTGYDQRGEVQLAGGTIVRVDRASEVTFLALSDPYAEFPDNTVLQLAEGTIQITAVLDENQEIRIDTPASSVYLLGDGDFRIEVNSPERTRVVSRRGVAEVVGNGGSVLVRGGMLADVYPGSMPRTPEPFNTFLADSFDRWVNEREEIYAVRDRYQGSSDSAVVVHDELPYEVRPYSRELSRYGDWSYVSDYGYVWHPIGISAGWRPYYDGYWSYGPYGYFWVSNEPWGWAPYHYGRWSWVSGLGWCWIPGRVFGGAWVAWSWGSVYVGWAPLDYWNHPVIYGSYYYDFYDPHCWTFISYTNIHHHHYPRYAVSVSDLGDRLRRQAVVTRPPRVRPTQLARSPEWRERAAREAAADTSARVRPVARNRIASRNMRNVERGMTQRIAGLRERQRSAVGGSQRATAASRGERGARTAAATSRETGGNGRTMATYPRRISSRERVDSARTGETAARARASVGAGSAARTPAGARGTGESRATAPGQRSRGSVAERTTDRTRDLYRRMSSPRTTRERSAPSARSGRVGGSESGAEGSRQTARPQSTPQSRGTTADRQGRSGSKSRARGARAAPSSGSRGSRSTAGRSSGGSGSGESRSRGGSSGASSKSGDGAPRPSASATMNRAVRPSMSRSTTTRAANGRASTAPRSAAPAPRSVTSRSMRQPSARSPRSTPRSGSSTTTRSSGSRPTSAGARSPSRSSGSRSAPKARSGSSGRSGGGRSGARSGSSGRSGGGRSGARSGSSGRSGGGRSGSRGGRGGKK